MQPSRITVRLRAANRGIGPSQWLKPWIFRDGLADPLARRSGKASSPTHTLPTRGLSFLCGFLETGVDAERAGGLRPSDRLKGHLQRRQRRQLE